MSNAAKTPEQISADNLQAYAEILKDQRRERNHARAAKMQAELAARRASGEQKSAPVGLAAVLRAERRR